MQSNSKYRLVNYLLSVAIVAFGAVAGGTAHANAITKLQPGLWEINLKGGKGAPPGKQYTSKMQEQLGRTSPSLRQRLEQMIGKHTKLISPHNRFCISKEQMVSAPVSNMGPAGCDEKVEWDDTTGYGNVILACPDGSKGRGQILVISQRQFRLLLKMEGGAGAGKQTYDGKLISNDCNARK